MFIVGVWTSGQFFLLILFSLVCKTTWTLSESQVGNRTVLMSLVKDNQHAMKYVRGVIWVITGSPTTLLLVYGLKILRCKISVFSGISNRPRWRS